MTGQLVTKTRCPIDHPECDTAEAFDSSTAILAEGDLAANGGNLVSLHDDYGYNWLQNMKAVGDLEYEAPAPYSPLTVESGTDYLGIYAPPGSVYVRIGLGSQEVGLDSMDINVTLGSKAASAGCCQQILGSIHLDGLDVKTDGSSYVTVYKTPGQLGIGTNVDVNVDRISLATLSWGDADGIPGASNAGYVGLKDTTITNVTASGSVAISVGRVDDNVKSVHMNLGNGKNMDVGISSLDTTVVLGDKKDFSGTKYTLGTLYMSDLKMSVGGYLDIYNPEDNNTATTLGFGLNIPWLELTTLSWGDPDGFSGASKAGYVGLSNLAINNLAITGQATVDDDDCSSRRHQY